MDMTEALEQFATDLKDAALVFKPKSPIQSPGPPPTSPSDVARASASAAADYRLDLTLQQLLAVGAEYAPDDIIGLRKRGRQGDPRWLYSLYDEMMRLGPAPQVLKAREAIKGTETIWNATPEEADEDENSTDPEDKAARLIRDVTEEAWGKWLPDIKTHLSTKFFYGIAAIQVMWRPKAIENRWARVTDIRPIPARRFRLDPQTLRFIFLSNPFSWDGPFVDDLQKTGKLIFVETGGDTEPLDQRGLLFQCLIPWAFEQYAVRWRGKKLQNFGMPPVMVTYQKGDPQNKATADLLADMLASGTRASIPEGMKAELLAAASGGGRGSDVYENAIDWCEREFDKIILGHSQVSGVQVGAGSKSSGKDAIGLFKDVTNSRAKELDNDMGQQCLGPYVAREFGQDWADNHTPRTTSTVVERDDPTELSTVLMNLQKAGLAPSVAAEDSIERCNIKIAEDGEMTMSGTVKGEEAAQPAQPPMLVPPGHAVIGPDGRMVPGSPKPLPQLAAPAQMPQLGPGKPGTKKALAPVAERLAPESQSTEQAKGKLPAPAAKKGAGKFAAMSDVQAPARGFLRRRKGKKALSESYTQSRIVRRQRFAAAAIIGGEPRVTLVSYGHDFGAPADTAMNVDVRSLSSGPYDAARTGRDHDVKAAIESHPITGAVYGGVKSKVKQAISAAEVTGDSDLHIGIGCEHGKHRSVYVAERLANDLRNDGHDVTVEHRDAESTALSGERGIGGEPFQPEPAEFSNIVEFPTSAFTERLREAALRHEGLFFDAHDVSDEQRDDKGRWTTGGGSGAKEYQINTGSDKYTPGVEWKQPVDENSRPIPIKVKTIEEAIPLVLAGKVVEVPDIRHVATLIDKLGVMAREAEAKGEKAPNYNLCNVTVTGTNLFCAENVRTKDFPQGIGRVEMPQLAGNPVPNTEASHWPESPFEKGVVDGGEKFVSYLAGLGIGTKDERVLAAGLKATQNELVGRTVAGIMGAIRSGNTGLANSSIFISKDNYVLDGHHRWAAAVGLDTSKGKFTTEMNVRRVDAPITELLHMASVWTERVGLAGTAGTGATHRSGRHLSADERRGEQFYSEAQQRDSGGRWTAGDSEAGRYAENAATIDQHAIASAYHHDAASTMLRKEPGGAADIRRGPSVAWEKAAMAHAKAGALHGTAAKGDHAASTHARDASHDAHAAAAEALKGPRWEATPTKYPTLRQHGILASDEEQQLATATERVAMMPVKTRAAAASHAKLHAAMRDRLKKQYATALDEAKKALAAGGEK